jgi:hypothetical protein
LARCTSGPSVPVNYLDVFESVEQPQSNSLGVIVDIEANGGNFISLRTSYGTLQFPEQADAGVGTNGACLPIGGDGFITLLVVPQQSQAILFVDLLRFTGDAGIASDTEQCPSTGTVVETTIAPFPTVETSDGGDADVAVSSDAGEEASTVDDGGEDAASEDATLSG